MDSLRPTPVLAADKAMPADDTRELARLAVAMAAVVMIFAIAGVGVDVATRQARVGPSFAIDWLLSAYGNGCQSSCWTEDEWLRR